MNIQGIVAVSGKPGLWRALAQNKTGYILESLDAQKTKLVANVSTAKLAALNEITIFGLDEDIRLTDIFEKMKGSSSVPDAKADGKALRNFFREIAPDHDEEKVYASDMKKVIAWFNILKEYPFFSEDEPVAEANTTEEADTVEVEAAPVVVETAEAEESAAAKPKAKAKKPAAKKAE